MTQTAERGMTYKVQYEQSDTFTKQWLYFYLKQTGIKNANLPKAKRQMVTMNLFHECQKEVLLAAGRLRNRFFS